MLTDLAVSPRVQYMSTEGPVSRDSEHAALLVTGDATGRPSLAALTTAVDLWTGDTHDPYRVPDTLIRYFPSEPIGYAADRTVGGHGVFADLVQYFKRGAGQYLKFDSRYANRATVSADHEVAMIRFAARIDEPAERRKWTLRLAHEHPGDPRTLYLYSAMLSEMLTRINTVDSVRHDLPLADSLWERSGGHGATVDIASVAARVGDSAANRRWILRGIMGGARTYTGGLPTYDNATLQDAAISAALVAPLRARIAEHCVLPAGRYPRWQGVISWMENCRGNRAWAFSSLSMIERIGGHPQAALALADSSLALYRANDRWCQGQLARRRRGEALLMLGDSVAAARELAVAVGRWEGRDTQVRDSLGAVLRAVVPEARWNELVAAAADSLNACIAASSRREMERRHSARPDGGR